jgi:hypothetical protein
MRITFKRIPSTIKIETKLFVHLFVILQHRLHIKIFMNLFANFIIFMVK